MAAIQPVSREMTLSESVYGQLKRALVTGAFSPGEKLTVRGIADAANISFTPAREAMGHLIAEGALQNAGPKTIVVPKLTLSALEETTKIRIVLEGLASREAADSLDADDVIRLSTIQSKLEKAMDKQDFRAVLEHNQAFHFLIYRKSEMKRLVQMIESCWLRIGPSLNLLYPEFSQKRGGVKIHHAIIDALKKGRNQSISDLIAKDIQGGCELLRKMVSD